MYMYFRVFGTLLHIRDCPIIYNPCFFCIVILKFNKKSRNLHTVLVIQHSYCNITLLKNFLKSWINTFYYIEWFKS